MNLRALNANVIVKAEPLPEEMKQGSIVVPGSHKDDIIAARAGVIVSVGPKANDDNTIYAQSPDGTPYVPTRLLQPGVRVRFNKYVGLNVDLDDLTLLSIPASELLAMEDPEGVSSTK